MPRLVTLDATNTLFRIAGSVGTQYKLIAERAGWSGVNVDAVNTLFGSSWVSACAARPNFGAGMDHVTSEDWWSELAGDVLRRAHENDPNAPVHDDEWMKNFGSSAWSHFAGEEGWVLFDDVKDGVKELKCEVEAVGVVANWDIRLPGVLRRLGLEDGTFDFIITSESAGFEKPHGEIFQAAVDASGLSGFNAADLLHVGDSKSRDVDGVLAFGGHGILIDRKQGGSLADVLDAVRDSKRVSGGI